MNECFERDESSACGAFKSTGIGYIEDIDSGLYDLTMHEHTNWELFC